MQLIFIVDELQTLSLPPPCLLSRPAAGSLPEATHLARALSSASSAGPKKTEVLAEITLTSLS